MSMTQETNEKEVKNRSSVPLMSPTREEEEIPFEVHLSPSTPQRNMKLAFAKRRMGRNPMQKSQGDLKNQVLNQVFK